MAGNVLNKAASLLRRKKYAQVIRILEPQVFRFRQNSQYYYILGMSYLYTGDIAGAGTYMKRVVQLAPDNIEARLAVAAIHVKLGQNQKAIETWLEVLESDPSNKTAKKGLDLLRQSAVNPEILENVLSSAQFSKILPVRKRKIYIVPVIPVILIVFIVPLVLYVVPSINENRGKVRSDARSEEVGKFVPSSGDELVTMEGNYTYVLTEKEIREYIVAAGELFNRYEDNKAQVIINRLENSNASKKIKDQARLIESHLTVPDFLTFKTNYSYAEVTEEPLLYEGCYVKWKGKISNLVIGEESITFDFIVGYHENRVVEGIIPVYLDFAVSLDPEQPVEVIGQLVRDNGEKYSLRGVSIRPLSAG